MNNLRQVIAFATMAAALSALAGEPMSHKMMQEPGFTMVGIECRTANAKEASGTGCIGKQWERLMREGLLNKIENRADGNIVAVYTNYASDANGEYTYVLGAKVTSADTIPDGMTTKSVPPGKYAVFTSDRGVVQRVVPAAWKQVWTASSAGLDRAYKADYELYEDRARDPQNSQMEIHVGVK